MAGIKNKQIEQNSSLGQDFMRLFPIDQARSVVLLDLYFFKPILINSCISSTTQPLSCDRYSLPLGPKRFFGFITLTSSNYALRLILEIMKEQQKLVIIGHRWIHINISKIASYTNLSWFWEEKTLEKPAHRQNMTTWQHFKVLSNIRLF